MPAVVPHARLVGAGIPDIIQHGNDGEEERQIPRHAQIVGNHGSDRPQDERARHRIMN